jgi:hypothetical protein
LWPAGEYTECGPERYCLLLSLSEETLVKNIGMKACGGAITGMVLIGSASFGVNYEEGIGCVRHIQCEYQHPSDLSGEGGPPSMPLNIRATAASSTSAITGTISFGDVKAFVRFSLNRA